MKILALVTICVATSEVWAEDFRYFDAPKIDYWSTKPQSTHGATAEKATRETETPSFRWEKYLDPKNDEFFTEGNYTPPAPFMEIARNPSDENIRKWFEYLETKNRLAERLQSKLEEFSRRQVGIGLVDQEKAQTAAALKAGASRVSGIVQQVPESHDYTLRMYFDSRCPHCEKMMDTLVTLSRRGFYVELRRVDTEPGYQSRVPFPIQQASPEELQKYQISAVPVLLVGDLKQKTQFRIQGYQTPEAVISSLATATRESRAAKGGSST